MTHPSHQARVEAAIADPTKAFKSPMAVVDDPALDEDEKRAILSSWAKDAELLSTAQSENMGGGEEAHLRDVKLALAHLDATHGRKH